MYLLLYSKAIKTIWAFIQLFLSVLMACQAHCVHACLYVILMLNLSVGFDIYSFKGLLPSVLLLLVMAVQ